MAKSFISINKGLGLLDFFTVGKYKDCRVDSIVLQDPSYIEYTRINFGWLYDMSVLDKVKANLDAKAALSKAEVERSLRVFHGNYNPDTRDYGAARPYYAPFDDMGDDMGDDISF